MRNAFKDINIRMNDEHKPMKALKLICGFTFNKSLSLYTDINVANNIHSDFNASIEISTLCIFDRKSSTCFYNLSKRDQRLLDNNTATSMLTAFLSAVITAHLLFTIVTLLML